MRELRLSDLKEQARRKAQLQSAGYGRLTTVPDTELLACLRSIFIVEAVCFAAIHAVYLTVKVAILWGGKCFMLIIHLCLVSNSRAQVILATMTGCGVLRPAGYVAE